MTSISWKKLLNRLLFISLCSLSCMGISQVAYSPNAQLDYPKNLYWGDTHLHTSLSIDSILNGNKSLGPDEAYRFAKGETLTSDNNMKARLSRPLDFLVVADHAFNLGLVSGLESSNPLLVDSKSGKYWYDQYQKIKASSAEGEVAENLFRFGIKHWYPMGGVHEKAVNDDIYFKSVWQQVTASADRHYAPGKFTTFIGYEWTSFGSTDYSTAEKNLGNLHRVVIFKDAADKANSILPFSAFDSSDPEDLWAFLNNYQASTGGDALAIPHNGNLSQGGMFSLVDATGRSLTPEYAKTRQRWEPLFEVTQMKGDSEVHPALSPEDEFADYETWNTWKGRSIVRNKSSDWISQKKSEYARSGLKLGLDQQVAVGVNPFKFGMIGSTDAHTSMATSDDDNFWSKFTTSGKPSAERILSGYSSAGYAAVWATENTREALFAAMKRKEVYASTGPRITVRFFAGWDYESGDAHKPNLVEIGYKGGVPMGGDLSQAPQQASPRFLIHTVKDPDGANLDRVQVIKGWRSEDGTLYEKIYNVALSGGRKAQTGKVPAVGSTVDIKDASYTNSIGAAELSVVWTDPDFNVDELSFYYLRVLEIPTPRWTAYDAKYFRVKNVPHNVPRLTQERVYTSPIWYSPPAKAGGE